MCFCDGYSFLIVNKNTEEKHFIQGDENLIEFFTGHYSLPCLFHRLLKKEYVNLDKCPLPPILQLPPGMSTCQNATC